MIMIVALIMTEGVVAEVAPGAKVADAIGSIRGPGEGVVAHRLPPQVRKTRRTKGNRKCMNKTVS